MKTYTMTLLAGVATQPELTCVKAGARRCYRGS